MAEKGDLRAEERFPIGQDSACVFVSPVLEDMETIRIKNISSTGLGFITAVRLDPGLLLAMKLVNRAKNFSKTMLVRIVHVTPLPGKTYLIGGTLDTPLTYEELCMFVM